MSANATDTWTHIVKNVLLLEDEDIQLLTKKRIRNENFFRKTLDITRLETAVGSKDGLFFELEDFFKYMIGHQPTNDELMLLTHQYYCDIPHSVIQSAYEVATSSMSMQSKTQNRVVTPNVTMSSNPIQSQTGTASIFSRINISAPTYGHINPSSIRTVDFIRYTNFSLAGTDDILKFYSDVQIQGTVAY